MKYESSTSIEFDAAVPTDAAGVARFGAGAEGRETTRTMNRLRPDPV
jgi:hypothetical protein